MQPLSPTTIFASTDLQKIAKKTDVICFAIFDQNRRMTTQTRPPGRAQRMHEKPKIRKSAIRSQEESRPEKNPLDARKASKVDSPKEHIQSPSQTKRNQERAQRMHKKPTNRTVRPTIKETHATTKVKRLHEKPRKTNATHRASQPPRATEEQTTETRAPELLSKLSENSNSTYGHLRAKILNAVL